MALILCPECGRSVSDKATSCPDCGCPINVKVNNTVQISFPVYQGQLFRNKCFVYENGTEIASCKQGETVTITCEKQTTITAKMQGCFGQPSQTVMPGERYKIEFRGMGTIYFSKVDSII